ncbi:MAG: hypothetical protein JWR80_9287 [Bradyrhizobium sp.]|nr:hypothetical protein [Bradyrhizobium sp.]
MVERMGIDFGQVDILVNHTGGHVMGLAEGEAVAAFRRAVELNLTSVFLLTQLVGRGMLAKMKEASSTSPRSWV